MRQDTTVSQPAGAQATPEPTSSKGPTKSRRRRRR
jgi:hypothetical protein